LKKACSFLKKRTKRLFFVAPGVVALFAPSVRALGTRLFHLFWLHRRWGILMTRLSLVVFGAALGSLACCVSPEEQHAMDQQTCAGYGFAPGTDAFAHCMMSTAQQREAINAARAQQQAAIYAQKQQQASYYKQLSLQRSGDTRFPVCNAASPDNGLDITTNSWYGSNCRAR
jgi:hypothetical protein